MPVCTKPIEPAGEGNCLRMKYFGENFYVVVTGQSFDILYSSDKEERVEARTKVGFSIISELATALLQEGYPQEDLASLIFTCSQTKGDLADLLTKPLEV